MMKFNIILVICALMSICGILFRIGIIPPLFGYSERYLQINEVIVNLSYSYLASFIFYLLNQGIPLYLRRKKAMILIAPKLSNLYSKMNKILAVVKMEADFDKDNTDVVFEDCIFANRAQLQLSRVPVLAYSRYDGKEWRNEPSYEWYDTVVFQAESVAKIKKIIKSIQDSAIAPDIHTDLMSLLYQIQNLEYFGTLETHKMFAQNGVKSYIDVSDGQKYFYDFIQLSERLKKWPFKRTEYKFVKMNEKEIADYEKFIEENRLYLDASARFTIPHKIYKGSRRIK